MSYILEALKKADQERGVGVIPDLTTRHEARRPQPRSYRWLWIVAALLIANAALLVTLLTDRDTEVPAAAQGPAEQQPPLLDDPLAQAVQQSDDVPVGEAPIVQDTMPVATVGKWSTGELVALPESANAQSPERVSPPAVESATPTEPLASAASSADLQTWYELPAEIRNSLTLPRLDLHVYSEEPQNRFIMVSLRKFREGERLESGMLLEEILPDGMVMSYRGERFLVEK